MTIKAIETVYNGYRFRSRTEARWAVFFDACGLPYEYEKEGYHLQSGWYLPDFYVPKKVSRRGTDGVFLEVKGEMPTNFTREKDLVMATGKDLFVLVGHPGFTEIAGSSCADSLRPTYSVVAVFPFIEELEGEQSLFLQGPWVFQDTPYNDGSWYRWAVCPDCGCTGIAFCNEHLPCGGCTHNHSAFHTQDGEQTVSFMRRAQQARFEHGETPA